MLSLKSPSWRPYALWDKSQIIKETLLIFLDDIHGGRELEVGREEGLTALERSHKLSLHSG